MRTKIAHAFTFIVTLAFGIGCTVGFFKARHTYHEYKYCMSHLKAEHLVEQLKYETQQAKRK